MKVSSLLERVRFEAKTRATPSDDLLRELQKAPKVDPAVQQALSGFSEQAGWPHPVTLSPSELPAAARVPAKSLGWGTNEVPVLRRADAFAAQLVASQAVALALRGASEPASGRLGRASDELKMAVVDALRARLPADVEIDMKTHHAGTPQQETYVAISAPKSPPASPAAAVEAMHDAIADRALTDLREQALDPDKTPSTFVSLGHQPSLAKQEEDRAALQARLGPKAQISVAVVYPGDPDEYTKLVASLPRDELK